MKTVQCMAELNKNLQNVSLSGIQSGTSNASNTVIEHILRIIE